MGSHTHMIHGVHGVHRVKMWLVCEVIRPRCWHLVKMFSCIHIRTCESEPHLAVKLASWVWGGIMDSWEEHVAAPGVMVSGVVTTWRWYKHTVGFVALKPHIPAEEVVPRCVAGQMRGRNSHTVSICLWNILIQLIMNAATIWHVMGWAQFHSSRWQMWSMRCLHERINHFECFLPLRQHKQIKKNPTWVKSLTTRRLFSVNCHCLRAKRWNIYKNSVFAITVYFQFM